MISRYLAYGLLGLGVLMISTSSILVRLAQTEGLSSLSIAALRLGLAALLLTPLALARASREIRDLSPRDLGLALLAGGLLAAHFAAWISSLAYTSVASSTALVTTNPVWIALASVLIFRERFNRMLVAAIAIAVGGSALIFFADNSSAGRVQPNPMLGNTLALLGAITVSAYLLIGRMLRQKLSLLAYIWLIYSSCAVLLIVVALIAGQPLWGFSAWGWLLLLGLALGPQLLGHTTINWALKHVSTTFIALTILGEPIGSALLAWLLFGEGFSTLQSCGFVALLSGIYLAARNEKNSSLN
jgi:drug/metabolite transporter (DMT)-like permease